MSGNYSGGKTKKTAIFANISTKEYQILMKFETKGHDREVDHPKKFGEDLCTKVHARSKNVHVRIKTCTHAYLCLVCT